MVGKSAFLFLALCVFCIQGYCAERLVKKTILNDKIDILIPESFKLMPDEDRIGRYAFSGPNVVYFNKEGSVFISVTYHGSDSPALNQQNEREITDLLKNEDYNSTAWINKKVTKLEVKRINDRNYGVRYITIQLLSGELTEIQYITSIKAYEAVFSFIYPSIEADKWKLLGEQILTSLKIYE